MSWPSPCPACAMGNHESHDPDHGVRPGLIGGTHCDCPGGCSAPDLMGPLRASLDAAKARREQRQEGQR